MNLNEELFKRYKPQNKLALVARATTEELLRVSEATIIRIIREVGEKRGGKSRTELWLSQANRHGNNWNSRIENLSIGKNKTVYLYGYMETSNTDPGVGDTYSHFLLRNFMFQATEEDRYGNPRTYYARYDDTDKAVVIRGILKDYLEKKYADKLGKEEAAV